MNGLDLKIKNLKAWIVLPELYEIEIGEWEEDDDYGGLMYHTFYRTYTYTNLFKDYVEKLNLFSLSTFRYPIEITSSEYINGYSIELQIEDEYLERIISIYDISSLIGYYIGNFKEEEVASDMDYLYEEDADSDNNHLKRIWRWRPPKENLERMLLEVERVRGLCT